MILLKMIILVVYPQLGLAVAEKLLGYPNLVMIISLVLMAITGYYVFSSLNLMDIAMAMFFTSFLISATINPYLAELLKCREGFINIGLGNAWLPWGIWGTLAVAVLYKVFFPDRGRSR